MTLWRVAAVFIMVKYNIYDILHDQEVSMLNHFICATEERGTLDNPVSAPLFRKSFSIEKIPGSAFLRICGLGLYRVFINGIDITKGEFAPY